MKTKYIVFTSAVGTIQVAKLREVLAQSITQNYDEIYFLISSGGGDVFEGLSLAALIKSLPMKTTMHNIGQVDSVATAIFSAGKERVSSKNSSFMFHGVTLNLNAAGYLEQQLKELYEGSIRMKDDIAKAISAYTSIALADIQSLMVDGGNILSAETAKTKGFITTVVEPQLPQNADVSVISNA